MMYRDEYFTVPPEEQEAIERERQKRHEQFKKEARNLRTGKISVNQLRAAYGLPPIIPEPAVRSLPSEEVMRRPRAVKPIPLWYSLLMSGIIVGLLTLVTVTMYRLGGNVAVAGWLVWLLLTVFVYALVVAGEK